MEKIDGKDFQQLESQKYYSFPNNKPNKRDEAKKMIFSGDYIGALKRDGAYYRFVKDNSGAMVLQGRSRGVSGDFVNKLDRVPHLHAFFEQIPNGTCFLGEIYTPENELSTNTTRIMGSGPAKAIARQKEEGYVHYYIFDIWAYNGKSFLEKTAEERFKELARLGSEYSNSYVEFAEYFTGRELWELLGKILEDGGEGVVITKRHSIPKPGSRTRDTLKIKKEMTETVDCFIIGANPPTKLYGGAHPEEWKYWSSLITGENLPEDEFHYLDYANGKPIVPVSKAYFNRWAGSFKIGVYKGGKPVEIGSVSGFTEEILSTWQEQIGKVIEISAMEIFQDTENRGLRHPRFLKFREDLTPQDCTWEKLFPEG